MKSILRILGFFMKEIREVARQPSLVVTLILGPFLILFLFGVGHAPTAPPLKAILVVPSNVQLPIPPDQYQRLFGPAIQLVGTSDDQTSAEEDLREGNIDIIVLIPADLYTKLAGGEHPTVTVVYNQIDPTVTNYIKFIAHAQVSEMNREILAAGLQRATGQEGDIAAFTSSTNQELDAVQNDINMGNVDSAQQRLDKLDANAAATDLRLDTLSRFVASDASQSSGVAQRIQVTRSALSKYRADLATLKRDLTSGSPDVPQDIAQVRADAAETSRAAAGLAELPAQVVASPLVGSTENMAPIEPDFVAFYTPAVLALLLQHIAVTFGALSMVRERLFGATELFRVAPISSFQVLLGKYLAYLLLGGFVTAALTFLIIAVLRVPFTGRCDYFVTVIVTLLLASLGVGFVISLISSSERQAVQLAMLVLIASVFFSGFFMPIEQFTWPVRGLAYGLPVTYGISSLQDVMLRGLTDSVAPAALASMGFVLLIVAILMLRKELAGGRSQRAGE